MKQTIDGARPTAAVVTAAAGAEIFAGREVMAEAAKAAPPVTVVGVSVAGITVNDVVLYATLAYLLLQIGFLIYRWIKFDPHQKNDE